MFKQLQADLAKEHHIHFNDLTLLEEALTQANYINEHPVTLGAIINVLSF